MYYVMHASAPSLLRESMDSLIYVPSFVSVWVLYLHPFGRQILCF